MTGMPRKRDLNWLLDNWTVQTDSGCWEYQGSRHPFGYGKYGRRSMHRWAYEELVGPIPEGLHLDHLCRNPPCCNPAHLDPVPHEVNVSRGFRGTRDTCSKGHPYAESLRVHHLGYRNCKTCQQEYEARRVAKRRAARGDVAA